MYGRGGLVNKINGQFNYIYFYFIENMIIKVLKK